MAEWQQRIEFAKNHYPDLIPQVPKTAREVRTILSETGIHRPRGIALRDMPIAILEADDYEELLSIFARKIVLAQYYRAFGRPLSRAGAMFAKVIPNAHVGDGVWLENIIDGLPQLEIGRHGNEDLGDQIMTRWHASRDGNLGLFVTHIQTSLFVIGMTGETERWREFLRQHGTLTGPFE